MNRLFYYSCLECTYKTKLLFKAKNHKEFHKNPSKKPFDCSVPLTKNIDQYKCYKCPQNFQTPLLSQLNCHITQNHTLQNFNPQIYKCQKCHFKSFSRYLTLRHKIIDKHSTLTQIKREEVYFHCEICDFRVKRKSILRRHMIRKHTTESEINWYTCEKCPFRAKFRSDLNRHKLVHSSQTLFHCNDCSFGTKRKSNLTEHIANVHDKPWLQCDKCAYKTKNMGLLVVHVRSEHDDDYKGWLRCPLCPYKCKLEEQLHAHQAGMHALVESVRHYKCPQCSYKASAQSAVKSHVKAVHSSNFFNCEHCEFRSKYKRNFLRHVLVKHTPPDKIQWVKCNQCEYKAKCKESLARHEKNQHGNGILHQCDKCGFNTRVNQTLMFHYIAKHVEPTQWFQCAECPYKNKIKSRLRQHILRQHNPNLIYQKCSLCPKKFKSLGELKRHRALKHKITEKLQCFRCDRFGCRFKTKYPEVIERHQEERHGKVKNY